MTDEIINVNDNTAVNKPILCPVCKGIIAPSAAYCSSCGLSLTSTIRRSNMPKYLKIIGWIWLILHFIIAIGCLLYAWYASETNLFFEGASEFALIIGVSVALLVFLFGATIHSVLCGFATIIEN